MPALTAAQLVEYDRLRAAGVSAPAALVLAEGADVDPAGVTFAALVLAEGPDDAQPHPADVEAGQRAYWRARRAGRFPTAAERAAHAAAARLAPPEVLADRSAACRRYRAAQRH